MEHLLCRKHMKPLDMLSSYEKPRSGYCPECNVRDHRTTAVNWFPSYLHLIATAIEDKVPIACRCNITRRWRETTPKEALQDLLQGDVLELRLSRMTPIEEM